MLELCNLLQEDKQKQRQISSISLKAISETFGKTFLDMDNKIYEGIFVKDKLNSAVKVTLDGLFSQARLMNPKR